MIRVKQDIDILEMLKSAGFSTYRLSKDKLFGSATVQKFRTSGLPSWNELDKLCDLLHCSPWDLIEYVPNE